MHRPPACLIALLALTAAGSALPGQLGLRGLYRVVDARTPPPGALSSSIWFLYQTAVVRDSVSYIPPFQPEIDTVLAVEDTEHYADATVQFGVGIDENFEAAITLSGQASAWQYDQTPPRGNQLGMLDAVWGFTDVTLAGKYSRLLQEDMTCGGLLWLSIPTGPAFADTAADYDGYWYAGEIMHEVRRPYIGTGGVGLGITGLFTYESPYGDAMGNLGFSNYRQEVQDPVLGTMKRTDTAIDFGVGYQYRTDFALLYTELALKAFLGRGDDPGYHMPAWYMLGIRVYQRSGAWLDLAVQLGLTSHDRDECNPYETGWMAVPEGVPGTIGVLLSLGWDSGMAAQTGGGGNLGGLVLDATTGEPVPATVSLAGSNLEPVQCDPVTGFYRIGVPEGVHVVSAAAEGYRTAVASVAVPAGGPASLDFRLQPASPQTGTVTGVVTDGDTGMPLVATITAEGSGVSVTSGSDGRFSMDLPGGAWTLRVTADGHNQSMVQVQVTPGGSTPVSSSLTAALVSGQVMSFANIYFDSGSATLKPESYSVLDGIADLLIANSSARIEVSGHTDSQGSESSNQSLSERRAAAVKDYLVRRGVPASMLTVVGYGETRPVATNDTADGRARNRRIEFRVL